MDADRADEMRDALAFMVAHASGDTEGAAAIATAADPVALAGALAFLAEGVITWQGNDPATWARSLQARFLAEAL